MATADRGLVELWAGGYVLDPNKKNSDRREGKGTCRSSSEEQIRKEPLTLGNCED